MTALALSLWDFEHEVKQTQSNHYAILAVREPWAVSWAEERSESETSLGFARRLKSALKKEMEELGREINASSCC